MSTDDDTQRVHFNSPRHLIERVDAIAALVSKDRTDLLNEALREYVHETANSDSFQQLVANEFYEDRVDFETVKQLVGAETAQRFRLLKADLDSEPLALSAPNDTDVYEGDLRTVEPTENDADSSD
jgi:hypothetical protein